MPEFLEVVQGAGGIASVGVFVLLWRLDRRLVRVETKLEEGN